LTDKLLALPYHLVLYPSHYSGSVCGRGMSATPVSTIGFARRHNTALQHRDEYAFVAALPTDLPPAPEQQAATAAAHASARPLARRARRAPTAADRRVDGRATSPAPNRGRAELGMDRCRERAARREPGPRVVDDRRHEDRPRRPPPPRPRARAQRGRRLRR